MSTPPIEIGGATAAQENHDAVSIRFESVDTLFYMGRQLVDTPGSGEPAGFTIDLKLGGREGDADLVSVMLDVILKEMGQTEPLARLVARCNFRVVDLARFMEEDKPNLPYEVLEFMVGRAYDTCRGVLIAKGAGTIVEFLVLPLLDAGELVQKLAPVDQSTASSQTTTSSGLI